MLFFRAEYDAETDNPRAPTCDTEQLLRGVWDAELARSVYVLLHDVLNTLFAEKVSVADVTTAEVSHRNLFFRLHHDSPVERVVRALCIVVCLVLTLLVCYGRVYLLYHTVSTNDISR